MYVLIIFIALLVIPVFVIIFRSIFIPRRNLRYGPGNSSSVNSDVDIDIDGAAKHLSQLIRIPSVSHAKEEDDDQSLFLACQELLQDMYPELFSVLEIFHRGPYGIAMKYSGEGKGKPVLFTAHYDVVSAETDNWTHPPFSGDIADGYVWGRGALDTKNSLIAILEAMNLLIASGKRPQRDIWIAFGGDEETTGSKGAGSMSDWFETQGVEFHFVFDEGAIIARDMLPGVSGDIALVGIEEKGFVNFVLESRGSGGHASSPRYPSAMGRVARALARIEATPVRSRLTPTVRRFFESGSFLQRGVLRVIMTNLWLFAPLLATMLGKEDSTRPLVATTIAATTAGGSIKDNVLPDRAWINLNVRILPGDTIDSLKAYLHRIIRDPNVDIKIADEVESNDPIMIKSDMDYPVDLILHGVKGLFEVKAVLPFMATASTDSKHYARLADYVIRFVPMTLDSEDLGRIHGTDERFSIEQLQKAIRFFHGVMERI